ncbi:hypothetical protein CCP3SC15_210027 [Gammaproteobacteria bacterium]
MITKEGVDLYDLEEMKDKLDVTNISSVYEWISKFKIPFVPVAHKRFIPKPVVEAYFKGEYCR